MKVTLKRMEPRPIAKISGIISGIMGFALGLITFLSMLLFGIASLNLSAAELSALPIEPTAGVIALVGLLIWIIMTITYAVFGFVFGAIGAWLYNFIASKIGGVEYEFTEHKK